MKSVLMECLPELGLDVSSIPALTQFAQMLLQRNQVRNLTAITEPKDVARLHLLDSLELIPLAGMESGTVVDVGAGAGFPGLPLAIMQPELQVTLLDSLGKRVDFLQEVCSALDLKNTVCVHGRAEEFASEKRESFDWAVSRAVASLPILSELCLPLVKMGGHFLAMKSSHTETEIEQAKKAIHLLGGRIAWIKDYRIPTADVTHRLICVEKITHTPPKYPRRFAQIKKAPLL